jgi:TPR repeat protein
MIKSGAELMANRDFAAARLMYQRAAEAGSVMAAFALAETYNPLVVGKLNARGGITPDFALAGLGTKRRKTWVPAKRRSALRGWRGCLINKVTSSPILIGIAFTV